MKLRNQNGAALIVVLLIITVFFVLGLSIVSSALSNTKQVNKTEKGMQALDLAEMGVLHYQNHFKEKVFTYLKTPIKEAMNDSDNTTKEKKLKAVYGLLDKTNLRTDLSTFPQRSINEHAQYTVSIEHSDIIFSPEKISVNISSLGKVDSGTQKNIDSTIEVSIRNIIEELSNEIGAPGNEEEDLPRPAGLNNCNYDNNILLESGCFYDNIPGTANFAVTSGGGNQDMNVYINGNAKIGAFNGGMKNNTRIDINGDAFFGAVNGGMENNTMININGNGSFLAINGGLSGSSTIFIKKDASFLAVNVKDNAKICVGGKITGLIGLFTSGIYSYLEDPNSYNNAGCPPLNNVQYEPLSLNPKSLAENTAIISVTYN